MKISINKTKIIAIIATCLLITSAFITALPVVFAQTTLPGYTAMPDRPTWTEVGVSPNFVGVGQDVTVNIMTYPGPSGPTYEAQFLVPNLDDGFEGISITIKHPDGYEETFMPVDETLEQVGIVKPGVAQIVGHLQFQFKPTKVGDYSFTANFPGEFYTTDNIYEPGKLSVYYPPSASTKPAILTVQQDKVIESGLLTGWPWSPLPEGYWENPVQTDNREWFAVSGDWLQKGWDSAASKYNLFSTSPATPHIVWTKELWDGGLPGGIWGSLPSASAGYFYFSPIVMDGNIYLNGKGGTFDCFDLRTGETLWTAPGSVSIGHTLDPAFQTDAQQAEGFIDRWLWGGISPSRSGTGSEKWYQYDPYDGDLRRTITNVPRDLTGIKFQDGSDIVWCVQADLKTWNTTKPMKLEYVNLIKWSLSKMVTTVVYSNIMSNDWRDGIVWNVSCQTGDIVEVGDNNFRGPEPFPYYGANVVVVKTPNAMQHSVGFDMTTGALLWKNYEMVHDLDVIYEGIATSPSGPLIKQNSGAPEWVAYDVKTGNEIWRAPSGEVPWGMLPSYECVYHDGVHFLGSYDGHVYAYNKDTGQQVWVSEYLGEQWETIYGNQPITAYSTAGADGKLYFASTTIYRMMPRTRFHETVCIDEYTGKFIWRLPIGIECSAIADGYLLGHDQDNGIMYCIGKGKTETSVTGPDVAVSEGTSVLISGSVMDMSPGAPNTPAISDEDMSEWMDYMYGQNATLINNPPTPKGVPVKFAYQSGDGSWIDIDEVVSDDHGNFGLMWTPPDEGKYAVKAFFLGSESYFGSSDTTFVAVGPAASPTGPIEPEPTTQPLITTEVAIIAAVAVVAVIGVAAFWVLKKRK